MICGKQKGVAINRRAILEFITPEDIYRYYWRDFEFGKSYCSPFRKDNRPSFGIVRLSSGWLIHNDLTGREHGDCFDFVMRKYGMVLEDALLLIDKDFNLGIWKERDLTRSVFISPTIDKKVVVKRETIIQVDPKKFTQEEYDYWMQYYLSKQDLIDGKVFSVERLWINKKYIPNYDGAMRFAYLFEGEEKDYLKIYTPTASNKTNKFITNAPGDLLVGKDQLVGNDTVIITKSMKDRMVLRKLHKDVLCVQSESKTAISSVDITFLKKRFNNVILNFDPDEVGVEACTFYNQFGFGYFNTPKDLYEKGIKDIADLAKTSGLDAVSEFLKNKGII